MPKVKRSKGGGEKSGGSAVPLAEQILQADTLRSRVRVKNRDSRAEDEDKYVDERLSRKILQQARIQQEELQTEYGLAPEKKAPATVLGNVLGCNDVTAELSMWDTHIEDLPKLPAITT